MGVAGSGKTTIGRLLSDELGWRFYDADDFHPPANVAKMSAGIALNDDDRAPWLHALRARIQKSLSSGENAVLGCSALKAAYRTILQPLPDEPIRLVYLRGSASILADRLANRPGHFMKTGMLTSQLSTLEEPSDALTVDVVLPPAEIVARIRSSLGL
jgi:gluconokinase